LNRRRRTFPLARAGARVKGVRGFPLGPRCDVSPAEETGEESPPLPPLELRVEPI
jgi:hypothetical protein